MKRVFTECNRVDVINKVTGYTHRIRGLTVTTTEYAKGLEGVIAAESKICKIDGEKGKLYHFGYSIEDLVAHCSYEEVVYHRLYRPKSLYNGSGEREFVPMEKR